MASIKLQCGACQASLNAPAGAAGKTLACPQCGKMVNVPRGPDPDPVIAEEVQVPPPQPALVETTPVAPVAASQLCPHCHASIPVSASKCRQCGEFVKPVAAARPRDYRTDIQPAEYVVALLAAPIGVLIGLLWLVRRFPKAGRMLQISGLMSVILMTGTGLAWYYLDVELPAWAMFASSGPEPAEIPVVPMPMPSGIETPPRPTPSRQSQEALESITAPPDEEELKNQPPAIQRALRANVRVDLESPAGKMTGSGIIMRMDNGEAIMLTNRHVIDAAFAMTRGEMLTEMNQLSEVDITYVTSDKQRGEVVWMAPGKVDLALIRAPCPTDGIASAPVDLERPIIQGEAVFAVGNPRGFGWSLTRGTVSALRQHSVEGVKVPVIQTDAAINPGNSGGGLYSADGQLIGVNNFIINHNIASGMGFAIRMSMVDELDPSELGASESTSPSDNGKPDEGQQNGAGQP